MKKILRLFAILFLVLTVSSSNTYAAVTTTIPISSYSGYSYLGADFASWSAYSGLSRTFSASFTASLPTGIKVTGANLCLYGYAKGWYSGSQYYSGNLIFYGQNLSGCPTWGWYWSPYSENPQMAYEWKNFDITSLFSSYAGGTQAFTSTSSVTSTNPDWGPASIAVTTPTTYSYALYKPYVQLTYSYIPTVPAISSPVAGSNNKTSVTLSASSSLVGGGTVTYHWQYSTDNVTYNYITSTTSTSYNWTIPSSIPDNSSVYVRCRTSADGVYSEYSSSIRFNKADDPAIAARLAAQAAETAALTAVVRADEVKNLVSELKTKLDTDNESPIISDFTYMIDKVRIVRNVTESFFITVNDNKTPLSQLQYRYRVNSGVYSDWALLSSSFIDINLGVASGFKQIILEVRDLAGNVAARKLGIFKF